MRTPAGRRAATDVQIVGLVGREPAAPVFAELAEGLQHSIHADRRVVLLASSHDDAKRLGEVLESLWSLSAAGVVVLREVGRRDQLARFAGRGLPVVVVGDCVEAPNVACVCLDLEMGARLAVDHLAKSGRCRIGMIGPPPGSSGRSPAARDFLAAVGAAGVQGAIVRAEASVEGGGTALRDLIVGLPGMDGVLAHDDLMAAGAIREAADLGIPVPGQLAVISADDTGRSSLVIPSLTSVRPDHDRLVEAVTSALGQLMDSPGQRPEPVVVPVELVVRESA